MAYLFSAGEDGDGFDVCGLGEEVEEVKLGKGVDGGGEGLEVGGEGFGRAGYVDESGCGNACQQGADFSASAGTRWIEDDEVRAVALEDGSTQKVKGRSFDGAEIGEFG